MSFPSHRTNASGNISKGFSRWRQKGGPARIRRCGVICRIRRFLLKWHSRERRSKATFLAGKNLRNCFPDASRQAVRDDSVRKLAGRCLCGSLSSASRRRGHRLNSRECHFNYAQSTVYNANYTAKRFIDLCTH